MIYNLHQYFCNLQKYSDHSGKTMETRITKNIFNKNEKKNVGMSKPKKHAKKVGGLT